MCTSVKRSIKRATKMKNRGPFYMFLLYPAGPAVPVLITPAVSDLL